MSRAEVARVPRTQSVTFSSGSTASGVADIRAYEYVGFLGSTAFGSTAVTFRVAAATSDTFVDLYEGSSQVTLVVSTNSARAYTIGTNQPVFAPWNYMQIVGNSTADSARTWTVCAK